MDTKRTVSSIRKKARRVFEPDAVRSEPIEILPDERDVPSQGCRPGSIEQQLDMCESGELRGDDIEHQSRGDYDDPLGFEPDMAESAREGDDWSGDEHSSGYQGTDSGPGTPGSEEEEVRKVERRVGGRGE